MLLHLLKLVWNRRRANALLAAEIFIAFLVVFTILSNALYLFELQSRPLGFDIDDVWAITAERPRPRAFAPTTEEDAATLARLVRELETLTPVRAVALSTDRPYGMSSFRSGLGFGGRQIDAEMATVTPSEHETLGLRLTAGRFLEEGDAGLEPAPIVINEQLARDAFGDEDPLGKVFEETRRESNAAYRVVGVIDAYRHHGDFAPERPFFFVHGDPSATGGFLLGEIHLRLEPGTTAEFEEELELLAQRTAPGWNIGISPLARDRDRLRRETLLPLALSGVLAGFLLLMVVLGVTGVLWQNVTRRTREMGLRRALGASRGSIHRQIVAEVVVLSSLAVLAGSVLAVQLPATGILPFIGFDVVLASVGLSALLMLALSALCGLYPGLGATRIRPAEALHFE